MGLRLYIWTCTVCQHRQQMDDDPRCLCGESWHYSGKIEKIRFTSTGSQVNFADCYCDTCCADIGDDAPSTPFGRVRNGHYTGVYGESLRAAGHLPPAPSQPRYTLPTPRIPGSLQLHPHMYTQPPPRMPRQGYYTMGGRIQEFWNHQLQIMGNDGQPVGGEERQLATPGYRQGGGEGVRYVPMQQVALMQEQQGGIYGEEDWEYGQQQQEYEDEYGQAMQGAGYEGDSGVGSEEEVVGARVEMPVTPPRTQDGPERMKELEGMIWSGALLGITAESLEQNQHGDKRQVRNDEHQSDEQVVASI